MNCANHPDRERVAFCQNCGKPLCAECERSVGNSIFCEPCYAARESGAAAPPPPGYGPASGPGAAYGAGAYPPPGPAVPGQPEPAIAALLGFIPGVGAMYNGQYAKGIVHLVVFAILVSLASDANGIFGLFVAGWIFYMVIEAHHTARARRDGTPLPNPFGLNDLGERLGFGRAWPSYPPGAPYDPAAQQNQPGAQNPAQPRTARRPMALLRSRTGARRRTQPRGSCLLRHPTPVPPVPPMPAYPDPNANAPYHRNLPTGAIWLIALGFIFLIGHAPVFRVFHGRLFGPLLMIAIGVWMFVRRMAETGHGLENDGSDFYRWRLSHALNGALWVILIGVLWMLNSLHVLSWANSWPIYMIAAGVLMIFRRTIFFPSYGPGYGYGHPPQPGTPAPPSAAVTSTAIVPVDPTESLTAPTQGDSAHDYPGDGQEGR